MADAADHDKYVEFFDPKEYLRQYYSLPQLAEDDADLFRILCAWLKQTGRTFATALDVGCGPTIHNTFAIAPYAERIELADYLPANLAENRKWLAGEADAHDWDPLFRGVLTCEGTDVSQLEVRKALYRSRVAALHPCDLRMPDPLGTPARYDLVTSFFCAECVAGTVDEWRSIMGRVLELVRPGGAVFFAAIRNAERYRVLGRWFPSTPITEHDFYDLLPRHGFPASAIVAQAIPAPDWADDGFDQICLVSATKN